MKINKSPLLEIQELEQRFKKRKIIATISFIVVEVALLLVVEIILVVLK